MSAQMPHSPEPSADILLRLDGAHKAYHQEQEQYRLALEQATQQVWQRHAPFVTEAKSVLLQLRAEAYRAGFSDEDLAKVESCSH